MLPTGEIVKRILGIDEAGRGPVIGPLVLAGVLIDEEQSERLSHLGVKDSKRLSRSRRNALFPEITSVACEVKVLAIPPQELKGNLTRIELEGMARLIRELNPTTVYLDAPVPPRAIASFVGALRALVGTSAREIIAENKADEKYPVVSAASIVAKVHRDQQIEQLREQYGNFGWGYPSERKTEKFLEEWFDKHGTFPDCVRQRWRTVQRLIQNRIQQGFFAMDES